MLKLVDGDEQVGSYVAGARESVSDKVSHCASQCNNEHLTCSGGWMGRVNKRERIKVLKSHAELGCVYMYNLSGT